MNARRQLIAWCAIPVLSVPVICCADVEGTRAEGIRGQEICIVDNTYTSADFRDAYERRVRAKGYTTRLVQDKAACPITTTIVATYASNGWGRYLKLALLTVLRDGQEIGVVRYRGARTKLSMKKVETVIGEMVDVLYP
jgi:hypothetical protein